MDPGALRSHQVARALPQMISEQLCASIDIRSRSYRKSLYSSVFVCCWANLISFEVLLRKVASWLLYAVHLHHDNGICSASASCWSHMLLSRVPRVAVWSDLDNQRMCAYETDILMYITQGNFVNQRSESKPPAVSNTLSI